MVQSISNPPLDEIDPPLFTGKPPRAGSSLANGSYRSSRAPLTLQEMDHALDGSFSAMLSAAIYTDNVWMIQTMSDTWDDMAPWRLSQIHPADPYQIERACLIKDFYTQTPRVGIPPTGQATDPLTGAPNDFSFQDGVFYFGDLACAALIERVSLTGQTVMELVFRGTEKETTGDAVMDRKNLIHGYFLGAYKDLEGHYERHRLLIDEAIRLANERSEAGENIRLSVSGHSLGGSMAEMFVKKDAHRVLPPCEVSACTFGSPGIGASQNMFSMLVHGFVRLISTRLGLANDNPRWASTSPGRRDGLDCSRRGAAPKLVQYVAPNDPIPKLGLLGGYAPSGTVYFSRSRDRDAVTGAIVRGSLLDISCHSVCDYEKTRLFSFARRALRAAREPGSDSRSVSSAMERFALARERAQILRDSVIPALEAQYAQGSLAQSIKRVLEEANSSKGMIPKQAPNSAADHNKFKASFELVGKLILQKLSARRATATQIQPISEALGQNSIRS